jgi:hypothetical protein
MPDCLGQTKIADSEPLMSMLESKIELGACYSEDLKTSHVVEKQIPHSGEGKVLFGPCLSSSPKIEPRMPSVPGVAQYVLPAEALPTPDWPIQD